MDNLSLIAAIGRNNALGIDNHLPWHISEDLKFYKEMTLGKNIIMGRKTLESMPANALKGRNIFVISSTDLSNFCDVNSFSNLKDTLTYVYNSNEEFIVVGGSYTYEGFLPFVDTMYLTELLKDYEADTYFPHFNREEWTSYLIDDFSKSETPYIRNKYVRKKVNK